MRCPTSSTCALLLGAGDDGGQVVAHLRHRQPAQAVVGAEGDDHHCGECLASAASMRVRPPAGGFSRDAGIDDAIIELLFLQAFGQQGGPGRVLANAVAGRKRIAEDEDGLCGLCSWGKQQQSGEQQVSARFSGNGAWLRRRIEWWLKSVIWPNGWITAASR
jgi:hypothetical protein